MKPGRVRPGALHHPGRHDHRFSPEAVAALACPHCGEHLTAQDGELVCHAGHTFDVAKQGYVALLGSRARTDTADSADMVAARVDFLGAGHYRPIAEAVAEAVATAPAATAPAAASPAVTSTAATGGAKAPGPVLEIGAGTAYYLGAALGTAADAPSGIALDSSKFAARRAAADSRLLSVVADAWSVLPLQDASIGTVLSIFAPRDPAEISRVLMPGGRLVAVTPTAAHLRELREKLTMLTVDDGKAERLAESFAGLLAPVDRQDISFRMDLTRADASALVRMGPSARHLTAQALAEQVAALDEIETVTGAVTVSILQKN